MKVICAGLGKTGTTSLASALRVLGYKVYDFPEHFEEHTDEWLAIYRGEKTPDFVSMYDGVDGVTDLPAAFWYEEILEAFPDAKVILTVRDNDEVWVQSLVKQLLTVQDGLLFMKFAAPFSAKVRNYLDILQRLACSKRSTMHITREYKLLSQQGNCSFTTSNRAGLPCVSFLELMSPPRNFLMQMSEVQ